MEQYPQVTNFRFEHAFIKAQAKLVSEAKRYLGVPTGYERIIIPESRLKVR